MIKVRYNFLGKVNLSVKFKHVVMGVVCTNSN